MKISMSPFRITIDTWGSYLSPWGDNQKYIFKKVCELHTPQHTQEFFYKIFFSFRSSCRALNSLQNAPNMKIYGGVFWAVESFCIKVSNIF